MAWRSFGQQGSISRTWYLKGERPRLERQQQFLSAYIYGAVCPTKDKSSAIFASEVSAEIMQIHLDCISQEIDVHAVIIMDRAGWHRSKDYQEYTPRLNKQNPSVTEFLNQNGNVFYRTP